MELVAAIKKIVNHKIMYVFRDSSISDTGKLCDMASIEKANDGILIKLAPASAKVKDALAMGNAIKSGLKAHFGVRTVLTTKHDVYISSKAFKAITEAASSI